MGCDIHVTVEHRWPVREMVRDPATNEFKFIAKEPIEWRDQWSDALKDPYLGRHYGMFGLMAGVRYRPDQEEGLYWVPPKGFPTDASGAALNQYTYRLVDPKPDQDDDDFDDGCSCWGNKTTRERGEGWVADGSSEVMEEKDGVIQRISGPDWHSASWLSTAEFKACIDQAMALNWKDLEDYKAILAFMESYEASGHQARLVIFFDN